MRIRQISFIADSSLSPLIAPCPAAFAGSTFQAGVMRPVAVKLLILVAIGHGVAIGCAEAQDAGRDGPANAVVRVKGFGATEADARQDAVRAALQQTMQQLIVTDRVIRDDQIVRDRIMSTMNGYVETFARVGGGQADSGVYVEADVTVSPSRITNFIAGTSSTASEVDGGSLFAESQRDIDQRRSRGEIFDRLLEGYPGSAMQTRVLSIVPDAHSAGDFVMKVEVSYAEGWAHAFTSGLQALSASTASVAIGPNACADCFQAKLSAAIDTLHQLPEFQQQVKAGRRVPTASACILDGTVSTCGILPAGGYGRSLKHFAMQQPNLLAAFQVTDAGGQSAVSGNRACLVKYLGHAAVWSMLVDPVYDPDHFSLIIDATPRIFDVAFSARDLQTGRAKNINAMPFFLSGGPGLVAGGPSALASYAYGPPTDEIVKGVTNLRNAEVDDICAEVNSIAVQQAPRK